MPDTQIMTVSYRDVTAISFQNISVLDSANIEEMGRNLMEIVEKEDQRKLVLDFSEVRFMSSQALGPSFTPEMNERLRMEIGWTEVARGQAIGHKRIDRFAPVTASRVRLNILSSSAEAHIREFQLFHSRDAQ